MVLTFSPYRLRKARMAARLTQPNLATIVGLSTLTIQSYEKGRCAPSADALGRLAVALDVAVDDLFVRMGSDAA